MHNGRGWTLTMLSAPRVVIHADPRRAIEAVTTPQAGEGAATISRYRRAAELPVWVLYAAPTAGVEINGRPLWLGIRVLRDRDAIGLGERMPLFFSTEELARVESFPRLGTPVFCARCKLPIAEGAPAVRCPNCGHWCEQSETKACWSYGPTCPMCEQPTSFETGYRWTPEEL
ncbi:MAG: hypothetical protein KJ072_20150 [Verrucomicrobia bacterium]|nr:hypothetical protein [Verrucomicrobiota bacterium]